MRDKVPNVDTTFQQPTLNSYANQIIFLLGANGIEIVEEKVKKEYEEEKTFEATRGFDARLYVRDGKFVLKKGSVIKKTARKIKRSF